MLTSVAAVLGGSLLLMDYVARTVVLALAGTFVTVGMVSTTLARLRLGVFRHILCAVMCPGICAFVAFWLMSAAFWAALRSGELDLLRMHWSQWGVLCGLSFFVNACIGCMGGFGVREQGARPPRHL